jgi:DNA processing protein
MLLEKFESPEKIFASSVRDLMRAGVSQRVARAIAEFQDFDPLERELCELPRFNARMVRWTDADYPPNLRQISDPPPFVFVRGDVPLADPHCVAVVGARAASEAGLRMAERLGFELAAKGFVVVSGLARGIDGAAHRGALSAGGRTIAVMGSGIDVIYPPEHRGLADSILSGGGALLSELPIGTQPLGENFPARNRILSGLCLGVVIVEAAERSGSLITARMALEQNRQVFAVPGSPLSGKARGSNRLLKEGAILIDCVEDVIEELAPQLQGQISKQPATPKAGSTHKITPTKPAGFGRDTRVSGLESSNVKEAKSIIDVFREDERLHVDAIIEASRLDAQTVLRLLLEMELHGIVAQHPGKLFSLA